MKKPVHNIPAEFGPDTWFELVPNTPAPFRAVLESEFERLQRTLLQGLVHRTADADLILLYRHAAMEASALAASTEYPLLVLPGLFEEKTAAARAYAERQAGILRRRVNATQEFVA